MKGKKIMNCSCCANYVQTTSITTSGTILTLTIPAVNLYTGKMLCVKLAQDLPTITGNQQIQISITGTSSPYNVITACAPDFLYTNDLRSCSGTLKNGMSLKFVFASDSSLFRYLGKVRTRICP